MPYICTQCKSEVDEHMEFCQICWHTGTYLPRVHRSQAIGPAIDTGIVSAKELKKDGQRRYKFGGIWNTIFPHGIAWPAFIVLFGPPGAGKTTVMLKLLDQWGDFKQKMAIDMTIEEGLGVSLKELVARLDIVYIDFTRPATVERMIEYAEPYDMVGIDSLQVAGLDAAPLRQTFIDKSKTLIVTSQVTKDGKTRGSLTSIHMADVSIELFVDDDFGKFQVHKDRFGELRKGTWTEKYGSEELEVRSEELGSEGSSELGIRN